MKRSCAAAWALAASFWACGCAGDRDVVFQTSTIFALMEGVYDGELTCGELTARGDVGLGTFDALDGEMVVVDGRVYQVRADGRATRADRLARTPFAAVTFFEADRTAALRRPGDFRELLRRLDALLPTKNVPYAVRIRGRFAYVKTRSVPRQRRPYPRLAEVAKHQPTFAFGPVDGVVVGFRLPAYVEGVNVPGWHLHFLTADRTRGGHVLDMVADEVTVEIDRCTALHVSLPATPDFDTADLTRRSAAELHKVEK